jgi:hypothetical protein
MNLGIFKRGYAPSKPLPTTTTVEISDQQMDIGERRDSDSRRPGKFKNISDFADPKPKNDGTHATESNQPQPQNQQKQLEYHPISSRSLSVRHIIHIQDVNPTSRIHDRIMLVIRRNSGTSFTCLTFCTHGDDVVHEEHCFDHAKLSTEANSQSSAEGLDGYFRLCISLSWEGQEREPNENAYINLQELWQIESVEGVRFAILGQARVEDWPIARSKIIDVFGMTMLPVDRSLSTGSSHPTEVGSVLSDSGSNVKGTPRSPAVTYEPRDRKRYNEGDIGSHDQVDGVYKRTTRTKQGFFGSKRTITIEQPGGSKESKKHPGRNKKYPQE